jgi:hypothetical protein
MRTFQVSDAMYEQLKSFVVDPFDDTPEAVLGRLIDIVNKAKSRWSPFEPQDEAPEPAPVVSRPKRREPREEEESVVVL